MQGRLLVCPQVHTTVTPQYPYPPLGSTFSNAIPLFTQHICATPAALPLQSTRAHEQKDLESDIALIQSETILQFRSTTTMQEHSHYNMQYTLPHIEHLRSHENSRPAALASKLAQPGYTALGSTQECQGGMLARRHCRTCWLAI